MELEVPVIFLEVTITTATIDQEADLVIVEKEVPNLSGHLQIQTTNLIITMAEVSPLRGVIFKNQPLKEPVNF